MSIYTIFKGFQLTTSVPFLSDRSPRHVRRGE